MCRLNNMILKSNGSIINQRENQKIPQKIENKNITFQNHWYVQKQF